MSTVAYPHIAIRSDGHPITADSAYKVRLLVEEYLNGATPAEMQEAHPRLTLSEIHAALSYYYDHKDEMDKEIARLEEFAEQFLASQGESPFDKRLREMSDADLKALLQKIGPLEPDSLILQRLKDLGRVVP